MGILKHTITCLCCGDKSKTNQSGKKFCSAACRQSYYRNGTGDITKLRNTATELRNKVTELHNTVTEFKTIRDLDMCDICEKNVYKYANNYECICQECYDKIPLTNGKKLGREVTHQHRIDEHINNEK